MAILAPSLHRRAGRRLLIALAVLTLPAGAAFGQAEAPWRALYRGSAGGESLWIDLTAHLTPPADPSPDGGDAPLRYRLEARLLFPSRGAVLFGRGGGDEDGGLRLEILDSDGGRGEPGAPGAPGTALGRFRGARSMSADDDGSTLQGLLILPGGEARVVARRVAQYEVRSYRLGPVEGTSALPHFLRGPWRALNDGLALEARAELDAFLAEGRAQYLEGAVWHGWAADDEVSVQGISRDVLSLLTYRYRYTGGAHGNHGYEAVTYVWDAGGPRRITLPELLRPGGGASSELASWILTDLRRQGATWIVVGDVTRLTDEDLALFSLTPAGLQFVFPPYAMGPYAEGTFTVTVPYAQARAWAPADGWLARFAEPSRHAGQP